MTPFEQVLGYKFQNPSLLQEALTHSSWANEHHLGKLHCNERLEFLGDSVLSVTVAEYLFALRPKLPEGELTRLRASLVCEAALAGYARKIGLGSEILLGRGERHTGGADRPSMLADCFEAVIAAIYLDGGFEPAKRFILPFVTDAVCSTRSDDYKTLLQEVIQKNPEERLRYEVVAESGPDHKKSFTVEVHLNSNVIGTGTGSSKKQAEQAAAREALSLMGLV